MTSCKCTNTVNVTPSVNPSGTVSSLSTGTNANVRDMFDIGIPFPKVTQAAAPVVGGGGMSGKIQEDFVNAQLGNTLNTTRYWFTYGGFKFQEAKNAMHVVGTASASAGFGIDTNNGTNGPAFDATGSRAIEFDISGKVESGKLALEMMDFSGTKFEKDLPPILSNNHMRIDLEGVSGKIGKLQWKAPPGTKVDVKITNISFSAGASAPAVISSVSDTDPIMVIPGASGRRSSGRYLQAMQDLYGYFMNTPGASKTSQINGIVTRVALHNREGKATHLCNGEASTSETQALFFNFATLYGAISGDAETARQAMAYLRFYMMPHDGAESPELPDSKLGPGPVLIHWMIDATGESKANTCPDGRPGTGVVGKNTVYNMYDPSYNSAPYASVAHNASGTVDLSKRQNGGGKHTASFGSSPDADQWLTNGAYWAGRFGLGNHNDLLLNLRKGLNRGMTPSDAKNYPNVMKFAIFWGEDNPPEINFEKTTDQLYSGYQDPAAWEIMGRHSSAQNIVNFLSDAQNEFSNRYKVNGPFMPVFKDGAWGWTGDDPNTNWAGFQYRAFAHLAHYYFLTGDQKAKSILVKFIAWTKNNWKVDGSKISIPMELNNTGANVGRVKLSGYSPDLHALMAQGVVLIAARDKDDTLKGMADKLLDDLVSRKAKDGSYFHEDPLPANSATYGFQNAEVGIAYGLYTLLLNN